MKRDCDIKHFVKDEEGRYIWTEKPYSDWQLVFVLNESIPEGILEQVSLAICILQRCIAYVVTAEPVCGCETQHCMPACT